MKFGNDSLGHDPCPRLPRVCGRKSPRACKVIRRSTRTCTRRINGLSPPLACWSTRFNVTRLLLSICCQAQRRYGSSSVSLRVHPHCHAWSTYVVPLLFQTMQLSFEIIFLSLVNDIDRSWHFAGITSQCCIVAEL